MKRVFNYLKFAAVMFAVAAAVLSCNRGGEEVQQFFVTITDDGNGTAAADPVVTAAGMPVTITATPDTEYVFSKWAVVSGSIILYETANPAIFTMPAENVVIKAEFVLFNGFDFMTDPTFKAYCQQFDTDGDGILSRQEAEEVTGISVWSSSPKIESLAGIETFTNLTFLDCYSNSLSVLDLSNNTALTILDCSSNNLPALDLSNNTALTYLNCSGNNISDLDFSNNTALTTLFCNDNSLSELNVSDNTALTILFCHNNSLSALNVSNNAALTSLLCHNNNLSVLDVSNNTALTELICVGNNLSDLDLTNNSVLSWLECSRNNLSAEAMRNMFASLPDRQGLRVGIVYCSNPGSRDLTAEDKKVAEDKNWIVA